MLTPIGAGGQTAAPAQPNATQNQVELTLPQVRKLAVDALRTNRPKLAYHLAQGLLQADPRSSFAHFTMANAQGYLGLPTEARKSAARAYRYADSKLHRFEAAELAARLSLAEERPTLTQIWLRRAVQNAPNQQVEQQLAQDYGHVRAINPFAFSIRGGISPSNNVNGGANTAVQIVDGLPITGVLSGSAQALAGTTGTLDIGATYRLHGSKKSRTELSARLYVKRVALSSAAQAQAPDVENSNFSSTYAQVGLSHNFALGDSGNAARVGAALGQFWYGGDRNYNFLTVSGGHTWRVSARTRVTLDASVEHRTSGIDARLDGTTFALATGLQHARENGDKLSFGLNLRKTDSDFSNARQESAVLTANYAFAKQMGPVKISTGIAAGYSDYANYALPLVGPVPGGRQDKSIYANINFFFPNIDYAGFAPTIRVSAGRKFSNVSRFETEELSVSLGVRSKF